MKPMRCVYKKDDVELKEYIPTLFSPLHPRFEPMRLVRRIRFLGEYIRKEKYLVYYLYISGEPVGYCVVTPGGRRLKCSTSSDVVIGPYYVDPAKRGKRYGELLIALTLAHCRYPYQYAYDWIEKENIPSIRASERCGFEKIGELNVVGISRKLVEVEIGDDYIFRVSRQNVKNV